MVPGTASSGNFLLLIYDFETVRSFLALLILSYCKLVIETFMVLEYYLSVARSNCKVHGGNTGGTATICIRGHVMNMFYFVSQWHALVFSFVRALTLVKLRVQW